MSDVKEGRNVESQGGPKPGRYYKLGEEMLYCQRIGEEGGGSEDEPESAKRLHTVLYDASVFRVRDYGGFSTMWRPQEWSATPDAGFMKCRAKSTRGRPASPSGSRAAVADCTRMVASARARPEPMHETRVLLSTSCPTSLPVVCRSPSRSSRSSKI